MVYTQWGNIAKALKWLETAYRVRDPGLIELKVDPLLDPLRQEPRYKAIERKLQRIYQLANSPLSPKTADSKAA